MRGYIQSKSSEPLKKDNGDLVPRAVWSRYSGTLETEQGEVLEFSYADLEFPPFNVKIGMLVDFERRETKEGPDRAVRVEEMSEFGLLSYYNQDRGLGTIISHNYENVVVSRRGIRNEDEPEMDSVYMFSVKKSRPRPKTYPEGTYEQGQVYEMGQIRSGWVKRVVDFGVFVDIGYPGRDALVHHSEWAWDPEELSIKPPRSGDEVQVRIIEIKPDGKGQKISASRKALLQIPDTIEAVNVFQFHKCPIWLIDKKLPEIAERDDILPRVKLLVARFVKSEAQLYRKHRKSALKALMDSLDREAGMLIQQEQYELAFEYLIESMGTNVEQLTKLYDLPESVRDGLRCTRISVDVDAGTVAGEELLIAIKRRCSTEGARRYIEARNAMLAAPECNSLERARVELGIEPYIEVEVPEDDRQN